MKATQTDSTERAAPSPEALFPLRMGKKQLFLHNTAKMLADQYSAYWIFNLIFAYQLYGKVNSCEKQLWTLERQNGEFTAQCQDAQGRVLQKQEGIVSSFPLDSIQIVLQDNVCLLLSAN